MATDSDSASISASDSDSDSNLGGSDPDSDTGSNSSGPSRKRPRPHPRPRVPSKSTNVQRSEEKPPLPSNSSTRPRPKSISHPHPESKHTNTNTNASTNTGLPPIRQYVLSKLTVLFHTLFSSPPSSHPLTEEESARYAADVERAMFQAFKDIHPSTTTTTGTGTTGTATGTGPGTTGTTAKESAGTRYKTQFNLLTSSLTKNKHLLRPSLLQSILSRSLPPTSLALLSASDLASAAQLEEMERAKQAVLESTVKTREEREREREMLSGGGGGVRAGRDGLEQLEDTREKEMWEVRKEEERERSEQREREYEQGERRESESEREREWGRERERDSIHRDGSASNDVKSSRDTIKHEPSRSPTIPSTAPIPHYRRTSTSTSTLTPISTPFKAEPAKPAFELTSAWGTSNLQGGGNDHSGGGGGGGRLERNQERLDLSDQASVGDVGGVTEGGAEGDLDLDLDLGYGSGEMDLDELDYTGEVDAGAAPAATADGGVHGNGADQNAGIENREKGKEGLGEEEGEKENRQRKKWEELMERPIEWTGWVKFYFPLSKLLDSKTKRHSDRSQTPPCHPLSAPPSPSVPSPLTSPLLITHEYIPHGQPSYQTRR